MYRILVNMAQRWFPLNQFSQLEFAVVYAKFKASRIGRLSSVAPFVCWGCHVIALGRKLCLLVLQCYAAWLRKLLELRRWHQVG